MKSGASIYGLHVLQSRTGAGSRHGSHGVAVPTRRTELLCRHTHAVVDGYDVRAVQLARPADD